MYIYPYLNLACNNTIFILPIYSATGNVELKKTLLKMFHGSHLGFEIGGQFAADPVFLIGRQSFIISGPKPLPVLIICSASNQVKLKKMTFNDLSWQQRTLDYCIYFMAAIAADFKMAAILQPTRSLYRRGPTILEISAPNYPCMRNFSATCHIKLTKMTFNDFSRRPFWISKWRPTRLVRSLGAGYI